MEVMRRWMIVKKIKTGKSSKNLFFYNNIYNDKFE